MVYKGLQQEEFKNIDFYFGKDGFGNFQIEYHEQMEQHIGDKHLSTKTAEEFLQESVQQYPGEITLLCLGALTNIANAMTKDPEFPNKVKNIVIMGGNYMNCSNSPNMTSEFNFYCDGESAKVVIENFKDITLMPFELGWNFYKDMLEYEQLSIFGVNTDKGRMAAKCNSVAL